MSEDRNQDRGRDRRSGRNDGRRHDEAFHAAQRAVRGLSRPVPDRARRDRLRADFAEGTLSSPLATSSRPGVGRIPFLPRGAVGRWAIAVPLAAVLVATLWLLPRGASSDWVVTEVAGTVWADGGTESVCDRDALSEKLRSCSTVQVSEEGWVELLSPGRFAIQVEGGSELTLPAPSRRWFGRPPVFELHRGTMRVATGPDLAGAGLEIQAACARVDVRGTTVGIRSDAAETCVSVFEGEAEVRHPDGTRAVVSEGTCRTVYSCGKPDLEDEIAELERAALDALRHRTVAVRVP